MVYMRQSLGGYLQQCHVDRGDVVELKKLWALSGCSVLTR
jgi:hypothetical protein